MAVTPIYGFPYPALTDSPNGPAQIQALAEAVEADLATTDANVAATTAAGLTHTRTLGGQVRTGDTAALNTVETQWASSGSLSLPASSLIIINAYVNFFTTVAQDDFNFKFRQTTSGGTVLREVIERVHVAGVPVEYQYSLYYKTTIAESRTWSATVVRQTGSGNIVIQGGSRVIVSVEGPSSLVPNI